MINKIVVKDEIEQEELLDFELVLDELEGDKALFFEIVERFLHKVKAQLLLLHEVIVSHSLESIVFIAHSIYGGASNLRMYKLAKIAFQLEEHNLNKLSSQEDNFMIYEKLLVAYDELKIYVSKLV